VPTRVLYEHFSGASSAIVSEMAFLQRLSVAAIGEGQCVRARY
jgi:hypothetical protein